MSKLDFGEVERVDSYRGIKSDGSNLRLLMINENNQLLSLTSRQMSFFKHSLYNVFKSELNLGSKMTNDLRNELFNYDYTNLTLGNYWQIGGENGRRYRIGSVGYTAEIGANLLVYAEQPFSNVIMHSDQTNGIKNVGYKNCDFRKGTNGNTAMEQIKNEVYSIFGENDVMTYTNYLCTGVNENGFTSSLEGSGCIIELMTETMIYGAHYQGALYNSGRNYLQTRTFMQLPYFVLSPRFLPDTWLQDPIGAYGFAYKQNEATGKNAWEPGWASPFFLVKGTKIA